MASLRRGPVIAVLVIGLGLAAAPAVFGMFSRAPSGGEMINDFRPYMTTDQIELFRGYLAEINAADIESKEQLLPLLVDEGVIDEADFDSEFSSAATFGEEWPAIDEDMSDMLDTMDDNLGNYAAVDALPPFALFPWFFLIPGLIIAGVAALVLWGPGDRRRKGRMLWVLAGLGIAVVAAPAVFGMFTRAPKGGDMINDFRSLMTRERVLDIQGYFATIGAAEGQFRVDLLPLAEDQAAATAGDFPALEQFRGDWPAIFTDFAPMIGTMSNNVDNYEDVDALPPFALFPWFFVIPGLLVAGLAIWARSPGTTRPSEPDDEDETVPNVQARSDHQSDLSVDKEPIQ